MEEQIYNYLDGPIQSMAEFFETRSENLEKSIPLQVFLQETRKRTRKVPRKGQRMTNLTRTKRQKV